MNKRIKKTDKENMNFKRKVLGDSKRIDYKKEHKKEFSLDYELKKKPPERKPVKRDFHKDYENKSSVKFDKGPRMGFVHYRNRAPVNLMHISTITCDEEQRGQKVNTKTPNKIFYRINFLSAEKVLTSWLFDTENERDRILKTLKTKFSVEL